MENIHDVAADNELSSHGSGVLSMGLERGQTMLHSLNKRQSHTTRIDFFKRNVVCKAKRLQTIGKVAQSFPWMIA